LERRLFGLKEKFGSRLGGTRRRAFGWRALGARASAAAGPPGGVAFRGGAVASESTSHSGVLSPTRRKKCPSPSPPAFAARAHLGRGQPRCTGGASLPCGTPCSILDATAGDLHALGAVDAAVVCGRSGSVKTDSWGSEEKSAMVPVRGDALGAVVLCFCS